MAFVRSGRRAWEDDFVAYYAAKGDMLRRTAFVLCGDWHLAEDLTQTAFTNLYRVWTRIERHDVLDQYFDLNAEFVHEPFDHLVPFHQRWHHKRAR